MTSHLARIRKHMALETKALLLTAERARLFDNSTNKGNEAEEGIRRWIRARYAPWFTVSSGEIIDSFDTNAALKSRQQDGILHVNNADANRFLLPSGLRLLPVETVAAVIEVKLTLTKPDFDRAERSAKETARLRLRPDRFADFPKFMLNAVGRAVTDEERHTGVAATDTAFDRPPVTFALFAFGGIRDLGMIRSWMKGTTISVVCCLSAGCTARDAPMPVHGMHVSSPGASADAGADDALWHFAETIDRVTKQHAHIMRSFKLDFDGYAHYAKTLTLPPVSPMTCPSCNKTVSFPDEEPATAEEREAMLSGGTIPLKCRTCGGQIATGTK